jgi:hypothetical protein
MNPTMPDAVLVGVLHYFHNTTRSFPLAKKGAGMNAKPFLAILAI